MTVKVTAPPVRHRMAGNFDMRNTLPRPRALPGPRPDAWPETPLPPPEPAEGKGRAKPILSRAGRPAVSAGLPRGRTESDLKGMFSRTKTAP